MENWKDIPGYEGLYQVSDMGNVRALNYWNKPGKVKVLKLTLTKSDKKRAYLGITLWKNAKRKLYKVHQLVAIAFLNHTPNGHTIIVDHINEDRRDNRLCNLRLTTDKDNINKALRKK